MKAATASKPRALIHSIFQSTPPVKAATCVLWGCGVHTPISIHAAREGGDDARFATFSRAVSFQSTPPVKAATLTSAGTLISQIISIHAAREGGDVQAIVTIIQGLIISIHAAREGGD